MTEFEQPKGSSEQKNRTVERDLQVIHDEYRGYLKPDPVTGIFAHGNYEYAETLFRNCNYYLNPMYDAFDKLYREYWHENDQTPWKAIERINQLLKENIAFRHALIDEVDKERERRKQDKMKQENVPQTKRETLQKKEALSAQVEQQQEAKRSLSEARVRECLSAYTMKNMYHSSDVLGERRAALAYAGYYKENPIDTRSEEALRKAVTLAMGEAGTYVISIDDDSMHGNVEEGLRNRAYSALLRISRMPGVETQRPEGKTLLVFPVSLFPDALAALYLKEASDEVKQSYMQILQGTLDVNPLEHGIVSHPLDTVSGSYAVTSEGFLLRWEEKTMGKVLMWIFDSAVTSKPVPRRQDFGLSQWCPMDATAIYRFRMNSIPNDGQYHSGSEVVGGCGTCEYKRLPENPGICFERQLDRTVKIITPGVEKKYREQLLRQEQE